MLQATVFPRELNRFARYLNGEEGQDDFPGLIEYLNHGPSVEDSTTYRDWVLGLETDSKNVKDARLLLPPVGKTMMPFVVRFNGLVISGEVHMLGFGKAVLVEVVESYYRVPHFLKDHYNWVLKAWSPEMLRRLDYIIFTKDGVASETYTPTTYDFRTIVSQADEFEFFLRDNSSFITNPRLKL